MRDDASRGEALEYFRRQGFAPANADEEFVAHVVAAVGDHNIVTTTDYPHGDSKISQGDGPLLRAALERKTSRRSCGTTPVRLYAL